MKFLVKNKKAIAITLAVLGVAVAIYYFAMKPKETTATVNVVGAPGANPPADKALRDRATLGY